jgi:hypothetical protein
MVFIGHDEVTDVPHEGGQNPFTLDITDYVKRGKNELTVCVWDPTEDFINSRGKQSFKPYECFYTRVSGIWQTVWMETVPRAYIESYRVLPDIDRGEVKFDFKLAGAIADDDVEIEIFDGGIKVAKGECGAGESLVVKLSDNFKLWSPDNPALYTFKARYGKDEVAGYFGMRKIEKRKDERGVLRFYLNNEPCFIMGTLDQGWWPDGLLTPPSEEAMEYDVKILKSCGYNTLRKHIKVEPLQYYAMCDRLGILVIQDLPSGNGDAAFPLGEGKEHAVPVGHAQHLQISRAGDDAVKTGGGGGLKGHIAGGGLCHGNFLFGKCAGNLPRAVAGTVSQIGRRCAGNVQHPRKVRRTACQQKQDCQKQAQPLHCCFPCASAIFNIMAHSIRLRNSLQPYS